MPNGDVPGGFTPAAPVIPRTTEPPEVPGEIRGAGLPAPTIPIPVPPALPSPGGPSRFPIGDVAANDPVFSRALPLLRFGGFVVGVASALDLLIREIQEQQIDVEQFEREETDRLIARQLGADNPLRIVEISAPLDRPRLPTIAPDVDIPAPLPTQVPQRVPTPVEIPTPDIEFEAPEPAPIEIEVPTPTPAPRATPAPSAKPLPVGTPGIGTPTPVFVPPPRAPFSFPISPPVAFPVFPPVGFPRLQPVGDPLTPFSPPRVPSPPTPQIPGDIQLPQQQPQPQPQQRRRCKPCPKKKKPRRRRKCFKGLFRQGPMTDQVDFTKWVEIDCSSGRELGKRKRATGRPSLRVIKRGI